MSGFGLHIQRIKRPGRNVDSPAFDKMTIDTLVLRNRSYLIDRSLHGSRHRQSFCSATRLGKQSFNTHRPAHTPATITTTGTKADGIGFENRDF
jgi:hypothetical protein